MATFQSLKQQKELKELLKRDHSLNGGVLFGLDGYIIECQARAMELLRKPQPVTSVVQVSGMARQGIYEALDRISGAFAKLDIPESPVRILVNLTPPDLPKDGTWLDLPLAILILQAAGILPDLPEHLEGDYVLVGEVGLHGEIRRVPGALSMAYVTKPGQKLIVPAGNEKECALILAKPGHEGCGVFPVSTLEEVIDFFAGRRQLENALRESIKFESVIPKCPDFGMIRGQTRAKRAAVISAAGGHNMLMIGPPGEGKSLIASAIPGILPKLSNHEKVELTRIYSAAGSLDRDGLAVTRRPMRSIHHTTSKQALIGGGSGVPQPGEITMAHLGVLFLDELAEFSVATLETLRQPMERGEIDISRVRASMTFPCRFTMVAAMNPCPCGYFGNDERCRCAERDVRKYQGKVSGPILDRIDLQVELQPLTVEERFAPVAQNESLRLRAVVERARTRQVERFIGTEIPHNAAIPGGAVSDYCDFSESGFSRFREIIETSTLSTRSMDRLAKVSRTISDLDDKEHVAPYHVDEAASFVVGGILRDAF
ncbi:YifB family Mg chelatase-like AAA ATPase [bacterium]|nr:YifB family Mg chelatase-like AAA ATPase [bacterium]